MDPGLWSQEDFLEATSSETWSGHSGKHRRGLKEETKNKREHSAWEEPRNLTLLQSRMRRQSGERRCKDVPFLPSALTKGTLSVVDARPSYSQWGTNLGRIASSLVPPSPNTEANLCSNLGNQQVLT